MKISYILSPALFFATAALLTACGSDKTTMERRYNLVDDDDKEAGQVKLKPGGDGEVVDNDGKVIARIVPAKDYE